MGLEMLPAWTPWKRGTKPPLNLERAAKAGIAGIR